LKVREWFKTRTAKLGAFIVALGAVRPIWEVVLFLLDIPGRRDTAVSYFHTLPSIASKWWFSPLLIVVGFLIVWIDVRRHVAATNPRSGKEDEDPEERLSGNSFKLKFDSKKHADGSITSRGVVSRSIDIGEASPVKMIDRGSGEDRKKTYENRPKLFLEYDDGVAATHSLSASGVFLKNTGGTAHNVQFEPEVRAGYTLEMDNPRGSVDGTPYPVNFRFCIARANGKRSVVTGPLAERMRSLFLALTLERENTFEIGIRCTDFEGNRFASRTRFKCESSHISSEIVA